MICDIFECSSVRIRAPKIITKLFITIVLEEEFQLIILSKCNYFVQYTTLKWPALLKHHIMFGEQFHGFNLPRACDMADKPIGRLVRNRLF